MPDFGLGAIQSPPDPRDYSIGRLYRSLAVAPVAAVALPAAFAASPMPAVLDQGQTPQCVAFSNASEQAAFDRKDQGAFFNFDEGRFFSAIGGGPNGAVLRTALDQRRKVGYPTVGQNDAVNHRIKAYYRVPVSTLSIKRAIFTFGPLVCAAPWANSWMRPDRKGRLPAASGGIAGGHAFVLYGWDNRLGLLIRNSWSARWGLAGDAYLPYPQIPLLWEIWRADDVIDK